MAATSLVEYEIGVLVSQALDRVGHLVTLNDTRRRIRTTAPAASRNVSILRVHATLNRAVAQASATSSQLSSAQGGDPAKPPLTQDQLQQLGSVFSRDPSALQSVVLQMWYSDNMRPDVSRIVPAPSLLVPEV